MFTYHLGEEITPSEVGSNDLRTAAEEAVKNGETVFCFELEERNNDKFNACGVLVYFPAYSRVGWALNAHPNWMDANGVVCAIERLNDPEDGGE